MTEAGPERKQGILPRIRGTAARWLRESWNEVYYGFSEGRSARDRVEALLDQERLGEIGTRELSDFLPRTPRPELQLRMIIAINNSFVQLITENLIAKAVNLSDRFARRG